MPFHKKKSIPQLKRELDYYRKKRAISSERQRLKSELRKEKYGGLIGLGKGTVEFGKAIGKSAGRVGRSLGESFTGEGLQVPIAYGGTKRIIRKMKRKRRISSPREPRGESNGFYGYGGIPDDLGF